MTLLEFWGCSLIAFGPALAMFSMTIAHDPIKIILLISSAFFWLLSFLLVSVCWAVISSFCDYLFVGAYLAVLSQELFRYLFHNVTNRAEEFLSKLMDQDEILSSKSSSRREAAQQSSRLASQSFHDKIPISYVSGLGFGLMNGAFSLMNVLTDSIGPGTVGLHGDSAYFLLVSSLLALAFILLNVAWSVLLSESIEKSDKRLALFVVITHLAATTVTMINKFHLQLISVIAVYSITILCGIGAFHVYGYNTKQLLRSRT